MSTYCMPTSEKVQEMLEPLFEGLVVKPGKPFELVEARAQVGVYVADAGQAVAACAVDFPLAAVTGSALSLMSPSSCKEAISSGQLNDAMKENLKEVMNICSRLLMDETTSHLKLLSVHPARGVPRAAAVMLTQVKSRGFFSLSVPRYGSGQLSVLSI